MVIDLQCQTFDDKDPIPVKLPCIFPGAPLIFIGASGNIQGNLTGGNVVPRLSSNFYHVIRNIVPTKHIWGAHTASQATYHLLF